MARNATEAIAWGRAQQKHATQDWHGMCLSFVRQSFGIDYTPTSAWPNAKRFAGEAWRRAQIKHPTTDASTIPAGVPIFWDSASNFDHIALSLGGGRCLSTDVPRGKVGEIGIDELTRAWGMKMWGWSEDLVGNRIRGTGGNVTPPSTGGVKPLRVDGVDISHHQSGAIGYEAALRAGVRWAYHKATEGATYADPMYARRREQVRGVRLARDAHPRRMRFGAYHFARPSKGDAASEAAWFLRTARPEPGDMLPMLDLEDTGGLNRADLTTWVRTFVGEVEKALGVKPIIYTPFDLDDTCGCMLWVARYNNRNEPPRIPAPWKTYDVRQFSNGEYGVPDQVAGFGHVDLNTMRDGLTRRQLRIPSPQKEPEPERPKLGVHLGYWGDWNEPAGASGRYSPAWIAEQGGMKVYAPSIGKRGRSGIDYALSSAPVTDIRVLEEDDSDHNPVMGTVTHEDGRQLRIVSFNVERDRTLERRRALQGWLEETGVQEQVDAYALQEIRQYHAILSQVRGYTLLAAVDPDGVEHNGILVRDGVTVADPRFRLTSKAGWVTVTGANHDPSSVALVTLNGWYRLGSVHEAVSVDWVNGTPVGPVRRVAARVTSAESLAGTGRWWKVRR